MTANDQLNVVMLACQVYKRFSARQTNIVHVSYPCEEGGVMHHHQSGHVCVFIQHGLEPSQAISAK